MGVVSSIGSLEEMCDLMSDNKVPEEESWWIFTFGWGQPHENTYVKIWGTFESARQKMFDKYGDMWAFQYSEEKWNNWLETKPNYIPTETLLEVIE